MLLAVYATCIRFDMMVLLTVVVVCLFLLFVSSLFSFLFLFLLLVQMGSPLAYCSQFILYDHAASRQPAKLATPHLCTVSLAWLLDSVSHFDLRDIEGQESITGELD